MCQLSKTLTDYVISKGMIQDEQRNEYEYGFGVVLEAGIALIVCFVIACMFHTVVEGILFFIIFIPLRAYAGGLHLNRYWSCLLLSCLTFSVVMLGTKYYSWSCTYELIAISFMLLLISFMYPIENKNRIVDKDENKYFKKKLLRFLVIDYFISLVCVVCKRESYLLLITITLFMVVITMLLGKIKNRMFKI